MGAEKFVVAISSRGTKTYYRIDDLHSINIQYSEKYNEFIISFRSCHKQYCISVRRFDITGSTFNRDM